MNLTSKEIITRYGLIVFCGSVYLSTPQTALAHSSVINNKAWQVCESSMRSDSCEYTDNHHDIYRGTCQVMSEKLLCVRNQPIVKSDPESTR
jgi:hypothetical protein